MAIRGGEEPPEARHGAGFVGEEVVADPAEEAAANVRWVHDDAVVLVDRHGLVEAHERTLDHVERVRRLVVLVASAAAMVLTALHAAGPP